LLDLITSCHPGLKLPGLSDDLFDGSAPSAALFAVENNMGDGRALAMAFIADWCGFRRCCIFPL